MTAWPSGHEIQLHINCWETAYDNNNRFTAICPRHIPYISSPSHCLLFATRAHTIATCFAVISRLCRLEILQKCNDNNHFTALCTGLPGWASTGNSCKSVASIDWRSLSQAAL